jgi:hypothetical protein
VEIGTTESGKIEYERLDGERIGDWECIEWGLGYSDHDDGGSGKTAEESVSTPSTASASILAADSLAGRRRSVHDRTALNSVWKMILVCTGGTGRHQGACGRAAWDLQVSGGEDNGYLLADGALQYSANEGSMRIGGAWFVRVGAEGERVVASDDESKRAWLTSAVWNNHQWVSELMAHAPV